MNRILRTSSFLRLERALDAVVQLEPELSVVRRGLLAPLLQLRALGRETRGVFGEDPRAFQRMRLMLSSQTSRAFEYRQAEGREDEPLEAVAWGPHHGRDCSPSVLHMGEVVLLALAAGRVGEASHGTQVGLDAVFGLASMALPAELVERMVANGVGNDQLRDILEGVRASDHWVALGNAQVQTFLDPRSQARRRCLRGFERAVRRQAEGWADSDARIVECVSFRGQGPELTVTLRREDSTAVETAQATPSRSAALEVAGGLDEFDEGTATIVLATDDAPPIRVAALRKNEKDAEVTISVPPGTRAGWVGVSTPALRARARARREAIAKHWAAANLECCLRPTPVDVSLIAPEDPEIQPPSLPVATLASTWGARVHAFELATSDGGEIRPGRAAVASVWVGPPSVGQRVEIDVDGVPLPSEFRDDNAKALVPAADMVCGAKVRARVFSERREPDDERTLTVTFAEGDHTPTGEARVRRFVVVRPAVVSAPNRGEAPSYARVEAERLAGWNEDFADESGRVWQMTSPPWIADDGLQLGHPVVAAHSVRTDRLLEQLESLAVRCPGFEDAVWIAIVPRGNSVPVFLRHEESAVAAGLVVMNTADTSAFSRIPAPSAMEPEGLCARVQGRIFDDDVVLTAPVRFERRRHGVGKGYVTEFSVVAFDGLERERACQRIATLGRSRRGAFVALLPADDSFHRVGIELREEALAVEVSGVPLHLHLRPVGARPMANRSIVLPRAARVGSMPEVSGLRIDRDTLTWDYEHPAAVPGRFVVEVGRTDDRTSWAPVATVSSGERRFPLARLLPGVSASYDRVRVVASDGWNTAHDELALHLERPAVEARIREGRGGVYWADRSEQLVDAVLRWVLRAGEHVVETFDAVSAVSVPEARVPRVLELYADDVLRHAIALR